MRELERRLRDLEAGAQRGRNAWCFADVDETDAEAVARRWPDGRPLGARMTVFRWMASDDAQATGKR